MKRSVHELLSKKRRGEKIVSLTAYDHMTAALEEKAGVDFILVGDSMAMAVLGEDTTLGISMDVMIAHTRAVRRGAENTLVIGDMPFGSYECSDAQAVENAVRFLSEGGADGVKLEGGNVRSTSRVRAIVESGIPVMGHLGLLPQSVRQTGGYRIVRQDQRERMLQEADQLEDAGVFAIVLESVEEDLARDLTMEISVPTIGIGAGRYTDGQILVVNDLLGLSGDFNPKFVKKYAQLDGIILGALESYAGEVRNGEFPSEQHIYTSREEK